MRSPSLSVKYVNNSFIENVYWAIHYVYEKTNIENIAIEFNKSVNLTGIWELHLIIEYLIYLTQYLVIKIHAYYFDFTFVAIKIPSLTAYVIDKVIGTLKIFNYNSYVSNHTGDLTYL